MLSEVKKVYKINIKGDIKMKKMFILMLMFCCCGCAEHGLVSGYNGAWKQIENEQSGTGVPVRIDKNLFFNYVGQPISDDFQEQCVQVHLFGSALNKEQCEEVFRNKKEYTTNDFLLAQNKYRRWLDGCVNVDNIQQINQSIVMDAIEHKLRDFELAKKWNDKKEIEQKYNKKVCKTEFLEEHVRSLWNEVDVIPTDCITSTFFGRGLMVEQQLPEGTRVQSTNGGNVSFLIEPNEKILKMGRGQVIAGRFIGTGKQYYYTDNRGYEDTAAIIKYLGF